MVAGGDRLLLCPLGKSDRTRPELVANAKQSLGDFVQCLFPGDPLPSGIRISLWLRPLKWVIQSIGMIHKLGRRLALETKYSTVRMIVVSFEPNDLVIDNRCYRRAMRRAQGAKTAHRLCALSWIQHFL